MTEVKPVAYWKCDSTDCEEKVDFEDGGDWASWSEYGGEECAAEHFCPDHAPARTAPVFTARTGQDKETTVLGPTTNLYQLIRKTRQYMAGTEMTWMGIYRRGEAGVFMALKESKDVAGGKRLEWMVAA